MQTKTRKIALTGILFALAIAFSVIEAWTAPFLGLPPGVKLGLANIVVMYALLFLSRRYALALAVLKAGFALLTRGSVAGLLSLTGGLLSLLVMTLMMLPHRRPSMVLLSVAGALAHNAGQLLIVSLLMGRAVFFTSAPVLLASGVGMGVLTSLLLRALLPALQRLGFSPPASQPKE